MNRHPHNRPAPPYNGQHSAKGIQAAPGTRSAGWTLDTSAPVIVDSGGGVTCWRMTRRGPQGQRGPPTTGPGTAGTPGEHVAACLPGRLGKPAQRPQGTRPGGAIPLTAACFGILIPVLPRKPRGFFSTVSEISGDGLEISALPPRLSKKTAYSRLDKIRNYSAKPIKGEGVGGGG